MTKLALRVQHGRQHVADLYSEQEAGTWSLAYSEA